MAINAGEGEGDAGVNSEGQGENGARREGGAALAGCMCPHSKRLSNRRILEEGVLRQEVRLVFNKGLVCNKVGWPHANDKVDPGEGRAIYATCKPRCARSGWELVRWSIIAWNLWRASVMSCGAMVPMGARVDGTAHMATGGCRRP